MLERRRSTMTGDGPAFPAPAGGLRDPSNTQADLRDAFAFAGLPGLTSHVFRKTVATLMYTRGRTPRNVSDQLGHSQTAMAQNKYMGRHITDTGAADILEALGGSAWQISGPAAARAGYRGRQPAPQTRSAPPWRARP